MARESWSKVLWGLAEVCAGLAEVLQPPAGDISMSVDTGSEPFSVDAAPPAPMGPEALAEHLRELAANTHAGAGGVDLTPGPDVDVESFTEDNIDVEYENDQVEIHEDGTVTPRTLSVPLMSNGIPLQECAELSRQHREADRRTALTNDAVNAMSAGAYYIRHCVSAPLRCEDWVRSVECIPGAAQDRIAGAMRSGEPDLQAYATYYREAQSDLAEAVKLAQKLQSDPAVDGELLDADRIGRLLFWLGDAPDVNALSVPTTEPAQAGVLIDLADANLLAVPSLLGPITGTPESLHPGAPDTPSELFEETEGLGIAQSQDIR